MKKKQLKNLRISYYPIFLIIMMGCTDLVTDQFPAYQALPTLNAILVAGEPISINVSLTGGIDSLPLPNVNNAKINLYIDGLFTEQLENITDGVYTSKTIVTTEKEYKCEMIIPNHDTVVCKQVVPNPTPILNIEKVDSVGLDEEGNPYNAMKITFRNNRSERNYYEIVRSNKLIPDSINVDPPHLIRHSMDIIYLITDPVLLNEGLPLALFSNENIHDSICTITLNNFRGRYIQLRSVTYDYYLYQKYYYLSMAGNSPLYSNIENAYGIFTGYSTSIVDTTIPKPDHEK